MEKKQLIKFVLDERDWGLGEIGQEMLLFIVWLLLVLAFYFCTECVNCINNISRCVYVYFPYRQRNFISLSCLCFPRSILVVGTIVIK